MSVFVRDADVWKRTKNVYAKVAGVWEPTADPSGASLVRTTGGWKDATAAENQFAGAITQGTDFLYTYTYTFSPYSTYAVIARGFNSATDHDYEWNRTVAFGSMTQGADFFDSRGEDRNIAAIYYVPYFFNTIILSLDGTNIPNDDRTFKSMTIFDTISAKNHKRSDAFYIADTNGGTTWLWDDSFSGTPPTRSFAANETLSINFFFGQDPQPS